MKALVSDISHQTKTPLANILLYAQLLEEKTKDEEEKELAQQILNQTAKLEFLIQALIKMSRLETDVLEVMPVCQSVNPLIEQAVEEIRGKAAQKQIEVNVEQIDEIQAVYDLKWTLEALGNILDNAVKYSSIGSLIRIEVKEYEFYVCICVQDQGIGVPERERTRIFERFYRGSQVQQEDGIGIGLYLARQILQKEKGYIKVQSKPGEGSCFGMYLAR